MKNSEYWKERFEQLEQASHRKGIEYCHELDEQFQKASMEIDKEIRNWYQRIAINNNISFVEAKKLLNAKELKEFKWSVEEYIKYGEKNALDPKWMKQLENASARFHITRLEALKLQTQQVVEKLYGNQVDDIDELMRYVYTDNLYHAAFEIQKGFGVGSNFAKVDENKLSKILSKPWAVDGMNFDERIWINKQKLINELHTELTQMCVLGKSPEQSIERIANRMNVSYGRAKTLVMTEAAYFTSISDLEAFKRLGVEKYEILATLDSLTSQICQDMDGEVFELDEFEVGVTAHPFHPNCRTVEVPYFDEDFDEGERAARGEDGKTYHVPESMTYHKWKDSFVDGGSKENLNPVGKDDKIEVKKEEQTPSLNNCKTTNDIVDLFKSHDDWFYVLEKGEKQIRSVDNISLDGVDFESAKTVYKPFEQVFTKFPQLKGKLNAVNSAKLSSTTYAQCYFGSGHGGIAVNTEFYHDINKLIKSVINDEAHGFHPKGLLNPDSVVMHELGHAIDDYLTYTEFAAGLKGWKPKIVSSDLRPKVMKACGLLISDISKEVSGYASMNAQEWFAECFAEYMLADNPRPVAVKFGEMLEDILKGVQ